MSRTLSINSGSLESLKVSLRCGAKAKACHTRCTLLRLKPQAAANERVLQCVACLGVDSKVIVKIRSTSASLSRRGVPGRGSSNKPSSPFCRNRVRHLPTICFVIRKRLATSVLLFPVALSRMMRARWARACPVFALLVQLSSDSRSVGETLNCASCLPLRIATSLVLHYEKDLHLVIRTLETGHLVVFHK